MTAGYSRLGGLDAALDLLGKVHRGMRLADYTRTTTDPAPVPLHARRGFTR